MIITKKSFFRIILYLVISIVIFFLTLNNSTSFDIVVCRILAMILFFYCITKGSFEDTIFNPYYFFSLVPLSLSLYSSNVSTYYLNDLNISTWVIALTNIFAFLVGLGLTSRKRYSDVYIDYAGIETYKSLVNDSIILFLLGRIPSIYEMITGNSFFLTSIMQLFTYGAIVCAMKSKNKTIIAAITVLLVGSMLMSSINKTSVLFLAMTYGISYYCFYVESERQKRNMMALIVVFSIFFIFILFPLKDYMTGGTSISGFFSSDLTSTFKYYESRINWSGNKLLYMPYMYFVQAWNNLQYVIETQNTRTYGLWILKPLIGYFQLDGGLESFYTLTSYSSFNTFTYITVFFKDFGYWFSWIGSFLLGGFVGRVYKHKLLLSNSALDLACYSLTACATLEMFFSNHFFMQSYPFTILIIMFIYKKCRNALRK